MSMCARACLHSHENVHEHVHECAHEHAHVSMRMSMCACVHERVLVHVCTSIRTWAGARALAHAHEDAHARMKNAC